MSSAVFPLKYIIIPCHALSKRRKKNNRPFIRGNLITLQGAKLEIIVKEGKWALIAGSAEGLGKAFSLRLAREGYSLVMVDRNTQALDLLADDIRSQEKVRVLTLPLDLGDTDAWKACMDSISGLDCALLVYCAAASEIKPFLDRSRESLEPFISANNRTVLMLVHAFASRLREEEKKGKILLISSVAGLIAPVYAAPYVASKAFLAALSRSLFHEFREFGIGITTCCAGIIDTPKFRESHPQGKIRMLNPDKVAAYALRMCGKKAVCVTGTADRFSHFVLSRLLPSRLSSRLVNRAMRKMYPTFSRAGEYTSGRVPPPCKPGG
jgi:short-subunit dehydrogenase